MIATTRLVWAALAVAAATAACQGAPTDTPTADPPTEVSVTVTPVVRSTLHAFVEGWGRVEPEPASAGRPAANARVTAPVSGVITRILSSEGQRVAQGALLFELDARVADLTIERARQAVRIAEQIVARQEQLGPGQATSQKAYQEAVAQLTLAQGEVTTAELQRRLLDVRAPIEGTIVMMGARLGDAIGPATVLAEIVDLTRLVVSGSIRSVDIGRVRRGQRLEMVTGSSPTPAAPSEANARTVATVDYIGPQVDSTTDAVLVRARVPTPGPRPGAFVQLRIQVDERPNRLVVPIESLVHGDGGPEVAVVQGTTATKMRVTPGLREGGLVEVEGEWLREGVSVVVTGAYGLPATSTVKVVPR